MGYVRIALGSNALSIESSCAWGTVGSFTDTDNYPCYEDGTNC